MAEGKGAQKTLLVADDKKDIVDLLTYHLTGEGFHVPDTSDGLKNMKIIRDYQRTKQKTWTIHY